ncbi:Hypothetical predicted protein [Lecanosticta acicola]|uniref:Uncharacterized protein n=1 Tax=Lecanosticta acicola TaxID=111012 RepID=A0AAI9EDQ9_9PEZI|nr:Hypothetical predicted protein [Lecanosticta acicola]
MGDNIFTEREQKLMSYAWRCFEGEPKVDYQQLANLAGMSNPRSAANAWAVIKKKLAAQADANGGDNSSGAATPSKAKATPKKRGKKAADEGGDDDEEATPVAKKVKTPRSGRKAKASETPEEADDTGLVKEESDEENGALL